MVLKVRGFKVRNMVRFSSALPGKSTLIMSSPIGVQSRFGKNLRRERSNSGLSQEELAAASELDRSYVGSVERGERNISLVNIVKLSKALDIPPAKLFTDIHE